VSAPDDTKPQVYVIDDNAADLVMARLLLRKEGCEPHLFEDQSKALETLSKETPNLILLDIEMPGISGLDLLKRLRRKVHLQNVPIVMVTGKSDIADVRTAIASGANDYIVKPLDPEIFEAKLWRMLKDFAKKEKAQQNWVEFMLEKTVEQEVQLQMDARVISIGEVSLTIQTNSAIPLNLNFYVKLPFLKELDIPLLPLSVLSCQEDGDFYKVKCNIIGMPEKELQKIRLFCRALWLHQK
jgi:DNA-binding response OmpR family regulator